MNLFKIFISDHMWCVYFIELSNNDIYVGFSNNLNRRLKEHASGKVSATSENLPIKLRAFVGVETKEKAMALEKYFKTGSGKAVATKRFL